MLQEQSNGKLCCSDITYNLIIKKSIIDAKKYTYYDGIAQLPSEYDQHEQREHDYPILPAVREFSVLSLPRLSEREHKKHMELTAIGAYLIIPFTYKEIYELVFGNTTQDELLNRLECNASPKTRRAINFDELIDYVFEELKCNWNDTPEGKIKSVIRQRYKDGAKIYLEILSKLH